MGTIKSTPYQREERKRKREIERKAKKENRNEAKLRG